MPDIHFYEESGSVHVWVTVKDMKGESIEALQYLSASDAMRFAKAMENCAIQALKNQS